MLQQCPPSLKGQGLATLALPPLSAGKTPLLAIASSSSALVSAGLLEDLRFFVIILGSTLGSDELSFLACILPLAMLFLDSSGHFSILEIAWLCLTLQLLVIMDSRLERVIIQVMKEM